MKKFFSVLVFVFLSVVGVYGQQIDVSVGLPIGSNIDNYSRKVDVVFDGASPRVTSFNYVPTMGDLKSVIEASVRKMAETFSPIPGMEQEEYGIFTVMASGPLFSEGFVPQKSGSHWTVPPEVLNVKLDYGGNLGWYIDGVAVVEMDIVTAKGTEHFSSEQNYSSEGFSACYIGALQTSLKSGEGTFIKSRYGVPSLQKENGVLPGSTLTLREKDGSRYATLSLMDGSVTSYSSPPPAFLTFDKNPIPIPLRIVRIHTIEVEELGNPVRNVWWAIEVDGEIGSSIVVEFSENLRDWQTMPPAFGVEAFRMPRILERRHMEFNHDTIFPSCFYRVRLANKK